MTNQEAFNVVWNHFITQGQPPSMVIEATPSGDRLRCKYRGPSGERCAAGALIPDELYRGWMENKTIESVIRDSPEIASRFTFVDQLLLHQLQSAHDEIADDLHRRSKLHEFGRYMRGRMESIAYRFNLSLPE